MKEKKKLMPIFTNGIIRENPVLRLVLGTCPTLAITTSATNAVGMGIAATFVLLGSNIVISLLRNVIPDRVRIPAFITIIAGFVTVIQTIIKAQAPGLDAALGLYLPLIVVNCIILGRAEAFAAKNPVLHSVLDALGMGVGFTAALLLMGSIREIMGSGTLFGIVLTANVIPPMTIMLLTPGGFFVYGILVALANKLASGGKKAELKGCSGCSGAEMCSGSTEAEAEAEAAAEAEAEAEAEECDDKEARV